MRMRLARFCLYWIAIHCVCVYNRAWFTEMSTGKSLLFYMAESECGGEYGGEKSMKIEIRDSKNPAAFYDEAYGFARISYRHPTRRIYPLSVVFRRLSILSTLGFLFILLSGVVFGFDSLDFVLLGAIACCLVLCVCFYARIKWLIRGLTNRKTDAVIVIDESKVMLENRTVGQSTELPWENIQYILISKRVIGFIPKKRDGSQLAIFCSTDYIREVTEAIKEYQKESLVVENKK